MGIYVTEIGLVVKVFCIEYSLTSDEASDAPYRSIIEVFSDKIFFKMIKTMVCSCYLLPRSLSTS